MSGANGINSNIKIGDNFENQYGAQASEFLKLTVPQNSFNNPLRANFEGSKSDQLARFDDNPGLNPFFKLPSTASRQFIG